jgi:Na+-driven multidrug efflux pump
MSFEQRALTKKRTKYGLMTLLLVIPVLLFAFSYYNDFAAFVTGQDRSQIADLGAEVLQPLFVTMIYVAAFMVFSAMMASFFEPQLKEEAFGTWSRWGVIFCLCFCCCAVVAAGLL